MYKIVYGIYLLRILYIHIVNNFINQMKYTYYLYKINLFLSEINITHQA